MYSDNLIKYFLGFPGVPGEPAPRGRGPPNRGFYFARHSQTVMIPRCPINTVKMWDGFSLMHIMGNGHAVGQDLGNIFENYLSLHKAKQFQNNHLS